MTDFCDATALAELVRTGQVSAAELVDEAIARIEATHDDIHAVIHPRFEAARSEAQTPLPGPLSGVPFLIKDLGAWQAGEPNHAGTRFLRDLDNRPAHDWVMTQRLRDSGLIFIGRTNTPEFGLISTTEPESHGRTRNPWNTEHSSGGSSGGSASAVAAGVVPAAHASDGGGSIRIPASECGLVGLKPSRGRITRAPATGDITQFVSVHGFVSHSVRDTALLLDIASGSAPGDMFAAPALRGPLVDEVGREPAPLRVGLLTHVPSGTADVDPACVAATQRAASLLGELGHHVEPAFPPAMGDPEVSGHFLTMWSASVALQLDSLERETGTAVTEDDVEPGTWALAQGARGLPGTTMLRALQFMEEYTRRMLSWWASGYDILLTPTLAQLPPKIGEFDSTPGNPIAGILRSSQLVPFTPPFNVTGQPAVSLPLAMHDGLPVGVQFVADYGREDVLISLAAQLERAAPWADRRPKVWAPDRA
jgi:amidase